MKQNRCNNDSESNLDYSKIVIEHVFLSLETCPILITVMVKTFNDQKLPINIPTTNKYIEA